MGYPEPSKRGKYMKYVTVHPLPQAWALKLTAVPLDSIWLWFRTGGPLVGGAIVLALNQ